MYNIEGKDVAITDANKPVILAGAHRFRTALDQYKSKDRLVINSGDVFFPSIRKYLI